MTEHSVLLVSPLSTTDDNDEMPSRKTDSSDTQSASRRSSLRRLSSIASLQTLFSRRRSNITTDTTVNSSSSNLSLTSSTIANAPEPVIEGRPPSTSAQDEDTLPELPRASTQSNWPNRKNSYVCLPDDPIGGMPRSRTFSNLPLPTRAKKAAPLVSSKSHSRLPSGFLPSTRLPSPSTSNRKHSHSRLASAGIGLPMVRNRMKRSDTEPLLGGNTEPHGHAPRSAAFKENITLSPFKPLPAMDMFDGSDYLSSSLSPTSSLPVPTWPESYSDSAPLVSSNFSSSPPESNYPQHPAVRLPREYKSSPPYRSAKERVPTPGGSKSMNFQRWSSQPMLTNATNVARGGIAHREIKQTRLMSARQPLTPPPTKNPPMSKAPNMAEVKSIKSSTHVRQSSEQSPSRVQATPKKAAARSPTPALHQIHSHEPPSYWAGRLTALTDRYRNEELAGIVNSNKPSKWSPRRTRDNTTPKSQTDKLHTPEATVARLKKAFAHLSESCTTREAKESLLAFQMAFAKGAMGCRELEPVKAVSSRIVLDAPPTLDAVRGCNEDLGGDGTTDGGGGEGSVGSSVSEGRKIGFMDRLLGREKKRRSLVF